MMRAKTLGYMVVDDKYHPLTLLRYEHRRALGTAWSGFSRIGTLFVTRKAAVHAMGDKRFGPAIGWSIIRVVSEPREETR